MNKQLTATVSEHVLVQQLGEETVLLDMKTEEYYSLNTSGTHLWQMVTEPDEPFEWNAVMQKIAGLYDEQTDIGQIETDMQALLDHLTSEGLLSVKACAA